MPEAPTPERAANPTPEALAFYHREIVPWLVRYSTTPSVQHDAEGAALLDRFRAEWVEAERKRNIEWHERRAKELREQARSYVFPTDPRYINAINGALSHDAAAAEVRILGNQS